MDHPARPEASSASPLGALTDAEETTLRRLLDEPIASSAILAGGRNSRVLTLTLHSGRQVVAKRYAVRAAPRLDPLTVECQALTFLERCAFASVPRLEAVDRDARWAILSQLPGRPVVATDVQPDVDGAALEALLDFLRDLDDAGRHPEAGQLPAASEASFSLDDVLADVGTRFEIVEQACAADAEASDADARDALNFLRSRFRPSLKAFEARARDLLAEVDLGSGARLPRDHRRLSPSDLGFHNALVTPERRFAFLDFEFFGWDDPAKTLADLLLHPRAMMPTSLRRRVVRCRLDVLTEDVTLPHRLRAGYPLFGLKWCLILLNEFLPHARARRRLALGDASTPRRRQLERAKILLERLHDVPNPLEPDDDA